MNRIAPRSRGKYDELLGCLTSLIAVVDELREQGQSQGAFVIVNEMLNIRRGRFDRFVFNHDQLLEHANGIDTVVSQLIVTMEGAIKLTDDDWQRHRATLVNARRWFERNNPPDDFGIKY